MYPQKVKPDSLIKFFSFSAMTVDFIGMPYKH